MREDGDDEPTRKAADAERWGFGYSRLFKGAPGRVEYWRECYEHAADAYRANGDIEELQTARRRLYHKIVHQVAHMPETDRDRDALMTAHALLHRMAVEIPDVGWGSPFENQFEKYLGWGLAGGRDLFEKSTRSKTAELGEEAGRDDKGPVRPERPRIGLNWGIGVRVRLTRVFYDRASVYYLSTGEAEPIKEARRLALGLMSFHLEREARSERERRDFLEAGALLARMEKEFPEMVWPQDRKARLVRLQLWAQTGGQRACEVTAD